MGEQLVRALDGVDLASLRRTRAHLETLTAVTRQDLRERFDALSVTAIYLDVAPYMRGRISPQKNYAAGVKPGDIMLGGGIGEVVQSNAKQYQPGDIVVTLNGDTPMRLNRRAQTPASA